MRDPLRITGDWPSPVLLDRYPNWENALDEEGVEGQDETTLRPSDDQTVIGASVPLSAGTVWLNDGRACPAIIEMVEGVGGVNFQLDGQWFRVIRWADRAGQFDRWEPYVEDWLPEKERCPSVSLADARVFPLRFATRLPHYKTSSLIKVEILSSGGEQTWI
jgi:hypothetical protein